MGNNWCWAGLEKPFSCYKARKPGSKGARALETVAMGLVSAMDVFLVAVLYLRVAFEGSDVKASRFLTFLMDDAMCFVRISIPQNRYDGETTSSALTQFDYPFNDRSLCWILDLLIGI